MLSKTNETYLVSPMFADPKSITYELVYSCTKDTVDRKHFFGHQTNDAMVDAASKITEYNKNPNITHAYVLLSRLPDGMSSVGRSIFSWTKENKGHLDGSTVL